MSLRRTLTYGTGSALLTVVVGAIVVFANLISANHYRRLDLTRNHRFTLSPQTRKVLEGLTEPVEAIAFFEPTGRAREEATQLFEQARAVSRKFSYRFVDPDKHPQLAQRYGVTQYGTTILERGERKVTLTGHAEADLTSGLIRVTRTRKPQIRFTTGHGERPLHGQDRDGLETAARKLEGQGFAVSELLLLQQGEVPEGTACLVIAGPTKPFLPKEVEAIRRYLEGGGAVFLLADPKGDADLTPLVKGWGVALPKELIIDTRSRIFGGGYTIPLVSQYPPHAITEGFNIASFFPVARPVVEEEAEGVTHAVIARTGPDAWGESDLSENPIEFDERDRKGPLDVLLLAERKVAAQASEEKEAATGREEADPATEDHEARLLVAGDADFPTNQWYPFSGNGDLFLNCVSWLAKEEALVSIRPKEDQPQTLALTPAQGQVLFYGFVIALPLATGACGLLLWRRRRRL